MARPLFRAHRSDDSAVCWKLPLFCHDPRLLGACPTLEAPPSSGLHNAPGSFERLGDRRRNGRRRLCHRQAGLVSQVDTHTHTRALTQPGESFISSFSCRNSAEGAPASTVHLGVCVCARSSFACKSKLCARATKCTVFLSVMHLVRLAVPVRCLTKKEKKSAIWGWPSCPSAVIPRIGLSPEALEP